MAALPILPALSLELAPRGTSGVLRCASDGHRLAAVDLTRNTPAMLRELADEIEAAQRGGQARLAGI